MVAWVGANWRQEITEDQTIVWLDVLMPLDYPIVFLAVKELRGESHFVPDFKLLLDRCALIGRRQAALGTGEAPHVCELCDGSTWESVAVVSGEAFKRCRCQGRPKEHVGNAGCTCLDCSYGERAKVIRAGMDGLRRAPDVDGLRLMPVGGYQP
jgi:hypothetical protein